MSLPGLVSKQRKMCLENPDLVAAAMQGTDLAVRECERQFKYDRWNCTLILTNMSDRKREKYATESSDQSDESSGEVLTPGLKNATREGSFIHAIMSAGIAHAVTVACRRGELAGCHCDKSVSKLNVAMEILREMIAWDETNSSDQNQKVAKAALEAIRKRRLYGDAAGHFLRNRTTTRKLVRVNTNSPISWEQEVEKISWGGCSDDVKYGVRFSRRFLEAPYKGISYKKRTPRDDVKLHNGEVGRRMVQDLTKVHCRCHGMSGACTAQTCWMQMASFHEIGDSLKRKFESGVKALGEPKRRRRLRHVTVNSYDIDSGRLRKVPKTQLAFINESPNLCLENQTLGILGTAARQCLKHSGDKGDCRVLCCGRGYNTRQIKIQRRCKCKFIYCCDVQCEICDEVKNEYTCKV
uniref:protein wingless-like n=1 Tax=Styela clava TaxID=7725 RepID=UPI00193A835A|nr:protein wingless-like [Styela clava]